MTPAKSLDQFMADLRNDLDPALLEFVSRLTPGRRYKCQTLWNEYNSGRGYRQNAQVFRYALGLAGMETVENKSMIRKTETPM